MIYTRVSYALRWETINHLEAEQLQTSQAAKRDNPSVLYTGEVEVQLTK